MAWAVCCAHKLADTLKTSIDGPGGVRVATTVDRSDKWLAQTPQMFRIGPLMAAIERIGPAATDEASAMEAMGLHPRLVPGGAQNFKVTYPDDFALASAVLAQRRAWHDAGAFWRRASGAHPGRLSLGCSTNLLRTISETGCLYAGRR